MLSRHGTACPSAHIDSPSTTMWTPALRTVPAARHSRKLAPASSSSSSSLVPRMFTQTKSSNHNLNLNHKLKLKRHQSLTRQRFNWLQ